jgi:DNA-binding MarR family transcriptional regulator
MAKEEILFLENQLCFPLYVASRLTTRAYTPLLDALGLTYPQYLVMLALWEKDQQLVGELSKRLYLDYNTITPLLKRLEEKGFIQRIRSRNDERSVHIHLSMAGIDLKTKAYCVPETLFESIKNSALSPDELSQFKSTLNKLMKGLEQQV